MSTAEVIGKTGRTDRSLRVCLGSLQMIVSLGAVGGGVGLLADPSGANVSMPLEFLADSPFPNYLIPGLVLLVVNGLGSLAGAIFSFAGWSRAGDIAAVLGLFLIIWIARDYILDKPMLTC